MVSRIGDVYTNAVVAHIVGNSASVPWIKVAIREDDVVVIIEVLLRVSTAEVVQSPVVLGSHVVSALALLGVLSFVPGLRQEHISYSRLSYWHYHLIAG